ncbi:MAG TPA: DUF4190 domain-containing protein [Candidatus Paceibacterota bacterium]|nr:DUF4190 domain-containing protein [Verrucomicrobiota bacterium]HSA12528.1 DUF4190 domain-containing protein [Candidatus Paceibacterota bacterium]
MSDFKFSCSNCGQHLTGNDSHAGLQVVCPSCGQTIVVPAAPGLACATAAPTAPPTAGFRPPPVSSPGQKTCGLAVASLVCSIGSFVIIPLGFIPGIICGHMARKKIAATPGLQGGGLAKAGLIVGYVALGLTVLATIALAAFFLFVTARLKQIPPATQPQQSTSRTFPRSATKAEKETTDTEPDGSGWTMNLAGAEIPSGPVTGRIQGESFSPNNITLAGSWLKFKQGKDFIADLEMDVVLFENDLTKLSNGTFTVPKEGSGITPHIWMKWKETDRKTLKQRCFIDRYVLRLEFGQLSDGKLPGRIYLCLPDLEKSFIAGSFEVPVKQGR